MIAIVAGMLFLTNSNALADAQSTNACSSYPIVTGGNRFMTFQWTNSGVDSEWLNVNNWNRNYLPGSAQNDRLIMAANDKATVSCPSADYMKGDIRLEMRARSTLDISSDLKIGDYIKMSTSATVTQESGGNVIVGTYIRMLSGSSYNLMGGSTLNVGTEMILNGKSNLSIQTSSVTSLYAKTLAVNSGSTLKIVLNPTAVPNGGTPAGNVTNAFSVNSGKLLVDASAYSSGETGTQRIPLIKFGSMVGRFTAGNTEISGLPATASAEIEVTSGNLDLLVTSTGTGPHPSPTKEPTKPPQTSAPVKSPQTSAPVNSPPTTSVPTASPTSKPTKAPTKAPVTNPPTAGPTPSPTKKITSAPVATPRTPAPVVESPWTETPTASPVKSTESPTRQPISTAVCSKYYPLVSGGQKLTAFHWFNPLGEDPEWTNVNNWYQKKYLPGSRQDDVIVLSTKDKAVISCPTSYMKGDISLKMMNAAKLDVISSAFKIGGYFNMDSRAEVTQKGPGGHVNVGTNLKMNGSTYKLLGGDVALNVGGNFNVNSNSKVIIEGERSYFAANTLLMGQSTIEIILGSSVSVAPVQVDRQFRVNNGKLIIDATGYDPIPGATTKIPLIEFGSMVGMFNADNLILSGLPSAFSPEFEVTADSLSLVIDGTSTSHPPAYKIDSILTVQLTANGYNPVVVGNRDVIIDTLKSGLVIDGSNYSAGIGTIPILDWRGTVSDTHTRFYLRRGRFDPKNIQLLNFDKHPGLWFELQYGDDYMQLVIKALTDYSEYSNSDQYTNGEVYPDEPDPSRFPEFSWDLIPRWTNARKNSRYKSRELNILAQNNAVLKVASLAGHRTLEEGTIATAIELRRRSNNPDLKIFCYWNSFVYWGIYKASATFGGDSWLRQKNGRPEDINNNPQNPRYMYNHDVAAMREWWIKTAVDLVSELDNDGKPVFDGIFIDKTADPRDGMTDNHRKMIKDLSNRLPASKIYVGNALRQMSPNGARDRLSYMDGSYMENWTQGPSQEMSEKVTASIQLAREALSRGKMLWLTSGPWRCGWPCDVNEHEFRTSMDMPLAIFLMIAETNAYFNYQKETLVQDDAWKWDSSTMPEFKKALGPPKGPPVKVGNTFSRHFKYLTVEVDLDSEKATLNWHSGAE